MKGYIAITVSLILSLVVLVVALTLGFFNFFTRFNFVDYNNKQTSYFIARSCLDQALLRLAENTNYAGNETFNVSSYQCSVYPVTTSGPNKIIQAHSQISGATTNLKLTVNSSTLSTVSLEELTSF